MRKILQVIIGATALLTGSCSPRVYFPDRTNAPMLREAGELKLTSSLKVQNSVNAPQTMLSPSFDLAASPLKSLGIIASYRSTGYFADEQDNYVWSAYDPQDSIRYRGSRFEFGAGYYIPLGNRGLFDIYGGVGFGSIKRSNQRGFTGNYDARYFQTFLQPGIGFFAGEVFEMGGGVRLNLHKYNSFKTDSSFLRYEFTTPGVDIEDPFFLIVAPYFNLNVGYKYAKFNMQIGVNANPSKPYLKMESPLYLSMGITLAIAPRFWQEDDRRSRSRYRR